MIDYEINQSNDDQDIKNTILSILKQTSYKWTQSDYDYFQSIVQKIRSLTLPLEISKCFEESLTEIDIHYNNKKLNTEPYVPFEFEQMPDGGKVITVQNPEAEQKKPEILSLGI